MLVGFEPSNYKALARSGLGSNQAREDFLKKVATLKIGEILDLDAIKAWRVPCPENGNVGVLKHKSKHVKPHKGRRRRKDCLVTNR